MWLEKLRELKKESGKSTKYIAEKTNMSTKTLERIFAGETDRPYMDTLYSIVSALGGSLDDLFAEGKAQLASDDLIAVHNEVERLTAEIGLINAENTILKNQVAAQAAELDLLRLKLEHKEEIIALHNYYRAFIDGKK